MRNVPASTSLLYILLNQGGKNVKYDDILALPPKKMFLWLQNQTRVEIPQEVTTSDELQEVGNAMNKLSSYYAFIMALLSYAQLSVREKKRESDKEAYEDMVDRRNVLENTAKSINQQYAAASRQVTIYLKHMEELKMMGCA